MFSTKFMFASKIWVRRLSSHGNKHLLYGEQLTNRSLIKITGIVTKDFLQGLITNDIEHLNEPNTSSIYTMFLNVQGRVLFDGFIFKCQESDYMIDCDSHVVDAVINHMKLHKVRRKLNFEKLDSCFKVWVIFNDSVYVENAAFDMKSMYYNPKSKTTIQTKRDLPNGTLLSLDPRLYYLGNRIILKASEPLEHYIDITKAESGSFEKMRFKLGIGEGVEDLSRGKCLPLEANCDYLHGVSFQKGCYVGQELTARTYHTGVVRKRFMPLIFQENSITEKDSVITNEKGKNVGKVINSSGKYGIGLLRVTEALTAQNLNIRNTIVSTFRPFWWPIEVSKERQNIETVDIQ